MSLFKHKQKPEDDGPVHFFDDYFREELRNKGRQFFEKAISENAATFQKDLDATLARVDADLQEHITNQLDRTIIHVNDELTKQIDDQFVEYGKAMKESQDKALEALDKREQALQEQHEKLSEKLQQNIASQESMLVKVYQENMQRITAMQEAQNLAVQMLNKSVQDLQQQHDQFSQMLQKSVVNQEEMLVKAFEENMAQIVEHYLLGALGDQYDMKAQLPSIIKQLEANKKEITEDMML